MIRVLGIKRIFLLLLLLIVNAFFAAGLYNYLIPEKEKKEKELQRLRGDISSVQTDISRLQIEFDQLEEQQQRFNKLEKGGFFRPQDRGEAKELLEIIQNNSRVISAVVNIESGKIEEHEEAKKAAYKLLVSPVTLDIEAIDDIDIYRYLFLIDKSFPGHVTINNIEINREKDITGAVLRGIAIGNNLPLVKASVDISWRTMIPESQVREPDKK